MNLRTHFLKHKKSLKNRIKWGFKRFLYAETVKFGIISHIFLSYQVPRKNFLNFKNYIINSFDYELSNGIIEGTNNIIKQVKHNACGYRKFTHLKERIMLIKRIYNPLNA